jgi:hypothetical protein
MTEKMLKSTLVWGVIFLFSYVPPAISAESENHAVILDSIEVSAGESFVMGINVIAGKIAPDEEPGMMGFGSFCIPLKYDSKAFVADSVIFINTLDEWDEKFTNPKIDTGFISLAGIYDLGGKDNPPVYSPDKQERIAEIFFTANKKTEKGIYEIELTKDPRQNNIYLGSTKGLMSITPKFKSGKIVVK